MLIPGPFGIRRLAVAVLLALGLLWVTSLPVSAALRIVSVRSVSEPAPSLLAPQGGGGMSGAVPPLEGPLMALAITLTDQRQPDDEFDWYATAHEGVDGLPLDPNTTTP